MQRREQQRRTAGTGGGSYIGGGVTGYSPVSLILEAPEPVTRINTTSPISSTPCAPAFKGTGMKLGAKKTKQAELLDALGGLQS